MWHMKETELLIKHDYYYYYYYFAVQGNLKGNFYSHSWVSKHSVCCLLPLCSLCCTFDTWKKRDLICEITEKAFLIKVSQVRCCVWIPIKPRKARSSRCRHTYAGIGVVEESRDVWSDIMPSKAVKATLAVEKQTDSSCQLNWHGTGTCISLTLAPGSGWWKRGKTAADTAPTHTHTHSPPTRTSEQQVVQTWLGLAAARRDFLVFCLL